MKIKQFYSTESMDNAMLEALDWTNANKNREALHITTHITGREPCKHKYYVTVWYK